MGFQVCPPAQDGYTFLGQEYQSAALVSIGRPVFMSIWEAQFTDDALTSGVLGIDNSEREANGAGSRLHFRCR